MSVLFVAGDPFTESPAEWQHSAGVAEPPWYGPVCPVVREGSRCEAGPYPDWSPAEVIGRIPVRHGFGSGTA